MIYLVMGQSFEIFVIESCNKLRLVNLSQPSTLVQFWVLYISYESSMSPIFVQERMLPYFRVPPGHIQESEATTSAHWILYDNPRSKMLPESLIIFRCPPAA